MQTVRVAAAQTPEFLEDIDAALATAADIYSRAATEDVALLCFPEGFLQGYLTNETSARRSALELYSPAFEQLLSHFPKAGPMVAMGLIEIEAGRLFNSAVVIDGGRVVGRYRKAHLLGGESIFNAGKESPIFETAGLRFGINICYDTNFPEAARKIADGGGHLIACPANNMLPRTKAVAFKEVHNAVRGERCRESGLWLLSADVIGEREGRIAWGPTAILNPAGEVVAQLPLEKPGLLVFDIPLSQ